MRTSARRLTRLLVLLAVVLVSCGTDDGATVRTLNSDDPSASGSTAGSGTGSGTAVSDAECSPVNPELEAAADTTIGISAVDFAYEPGDIEVEQGTVTFEVANDGANVHELAFLPGGGEVPFTDDGEPDEDALGAAGAFELEGFGSGQTCNATYELDAGDYTIFCIIETDDGVTHYEQGMEAALTVS